MSSIYGFFAGSHSASSSLIIDGEIIHCIEEERLTRIKSGDVFESFPDLSSKKIEDLTKLKIKNADYRIFVEPIPDKYARDLTNNNYETVSHHEAHCYGSYFTSNMSGKVISISYDGGGDFSVMKVYLCEDGKMQLVYSMDMSSFGSLSHLWGFAVSGILGYDEWGEGIWKMIKDEGKLMGMAPNGYYDEDIYNMLKSCINYNNFRFYPSSTGNRTKFLMDSMRNLGYFDTIEKREIFSFNLQKLTEDLFLKFMDDIHKRFPDYKQFCFSGGLFANVKLNQKINDLDWVEEIYIYPAMGDEGLSLGACIKKAVELGEITKPKKLNNLFLGVSYNKTEIESFAKGFKLYSHKYDPFDIAKDLDSGLIIGWFKNGFEYGPRSLGARSILVKATNQETHAELNKRLKRNDVMPFAPIVMEEFFDEIFSSSKSKYTAEFMTLCYNTREEWIDKIPAVIQMSDKTARPQIVKKTCLPDFWEILYSYYKISRIPVLLNTSFNSHNQPIIDSPEQAFKMLEDGIVDKLVLEDYVYTCK